MHQLQIVHEDAADAVRALEPPGLGPELQRRQGRGVIDVDRGLGRDPAGLHQLLIVLGAEHPFADELGIDAAVAAQEPLGQLLLAHFQREDRQRDLFDDPDVLGDIQRQARLAHAGPAGDDDHLALLQAAGLVIQLVISRRQPGDVGPFALLDQLEGLRDEVLQGHRGVGDALVRDGEDLPLGLVELLAGGHRSRRRRLSGSRWPRRWSRAGAFSPGRSPRSTGRSPRRGRSRCTRWRYSGPPMASIWLQRSSSLRTSRPSIPSPRFFSNKAMMASKIN